MDKLARTRTAEASSSPWRLILIGATAGLVAIVAGLSAMAQTAASAVPEDGVLPFKVYRDGDPMGSHIIRFERDGERVIVDISIDLSVSFAIFPVFTYSHSNREVWENGSLVRLEASTDDDGTESWVRAERGDEGVRVQSDDHDYVAPHDVIPSSYWNRATVERSELLNTQTGALEPVAIEPLGTEMVRVDGRMVEAERYRMTDALELDIWYHTETGTLVKLMFEARGSDVEYMYDSSVVRAGG